MIIDKGYVPAKETLKYIMNGERSTKVENWIDILKNKESLIKEKIQKRRDYEYEENNLRRLKKQI